MGANVASVDQMRPARAAGRMWPIMLVCKLKLGRKRRDDLWRIGLLARVLRLPLAHFKEKNSLRLSWMRVNNVVVVVLIASRVRVASVWRHLGV